MLTVFVSLLALTLWLDARFPGQPGPRARDLMTIILCPVQQRLSSARKLSQDLWWTEEVGPAAAQPGDCTATALTVHVKKLL